MRTLEQIKLADKDREALQEVSAVLRAKLPIDKIILFGSKARGDGREDSDADLLILTSRTLTSDEHDLMIHEILQNELQRSVMISPMIVPAIEWNEGVYIAMLLHSEVDRDGVLI